MSDFAANGKYIAKTHEGRHRIRNGWHNRGGALFTARKRAPLTNKGYRKNAQ